MPSPADSRPQTKVALGRLADTTSGGASASGTRARRSILGGAASPPPKELRLADVPLERRARLRMTGAVIAAATTMGAVHLTVADLERSIAFYERSIGLRALRVVPGVASLGVPGRELVALREEPGAVPARGAAGLFHLALLLPAREELARWLAHAAQAQVPLTGLSEHFVSEAIYLDDPDGHGIEIYADRPRERWEGQVARRLTTEPLDVGDLLATLGDRVPEDFGGLPAGTTMGHVHLRVADIPASTRFYGEVLGFAAMAVLGRSAAFLGAGGYHHHIGVNTWGSAGASTAPPGTATLVKAAIVLPDDAARDPVLARAAAAGHPGEATETGVLIRDPSGIALELQVAVSGDRVPAQAAGGD